MSLRRVVGSLFAAALCAFGASTVAGCASDQAEDTEAGESAASVARPKQFVLLAFDGSSSLPFWRESRQFAKDNKLKFTYFISGVYFVPNSARAQYSSPRGTGRSDIGFGGDNVNNIAARFEQVRLAHSDGHEIASHANGHFDGGRWTEAQWALEFSQFDDMIFRGVGVRAPNLGFQARDVVGFRAPLLGHSPGLYSLLPSAGFAYDTSKVAAADYWPEKIGGVWNFPLARLRIVGTEQATLSMDYNFYFADSRGQPDAANKERYRRQMIDTYMKYFESNYFGNRAPVHIGHHFSKWNGGAYWEAMQTFARRVCGLPEVQCGTYKELLAFVEENRGRRADLQAGNFQRMPRPPGSEDDTAAVVSGITDADIQIPEDNHAHDEDGEGEEEE